MSHASTYRPTDTATERSPEMSTVLIAAAAGFVGFLFGMFTVALCLVAAKADEPMSPEDQKRVRERLLEIAGSPKARSHWAEDYDLEQWAELQKPERKVH